MVCFIFQNMSGYTFQGILEGKEVIFDERINMDGGLLSRLEARKIITSLQRTIIEVTFNTLCQWQETRSNVLNKTKTELKKINA